MLDEKDNNVANNSEQVNETESSKVKPEVTTDEKPEKDEKTEEIVEVANDDDDVNENESSKSTPDTTAIDKKVTTEKTEEKIETSNDAVNEIEDKIAESSENGNHSKVEAKNYKAMSLEELVDEFTVLVDQNPVQSIHTNVNKIKSVFNAKFSVLLKAEKAKFLEAGGNSIDFKYDNPVKLNFNKKFNEYKTKRTEHYKNLETELQENLQTKLDLIDELKHLIDNAEGATMYKNFKGIQERWNRIGPIPRTKYNDTWRTYHHHVERFYDLLHLSNDLRDLDFKHNYDEKIKLVEKAEALSEMDDVNAAFKELQVLHKMWKEEVGPVAREQREEIWNRFSEATKKVHDKRHDYYKNLKASYEGNIDKKLAVIEEINAYDTSNNKNRTDWQRSIKEIEALREKFFKAGKVPRSKSDEIWNKFKEATRKFNSEKNQFFKNIKQEQLDNLNKKKALIEQAQALKDSDDWQMATDVMKKIQADWKKIGHVPRKYSDKLWKEFKDACNHYFDRLHQRQDQGNKEQVEVFNKKKELLNELRTKLDDESEISMDELNEYFTMWSSLGLVPYEMRHIEAKFNKTIDKIINNNSGLDKTEVEMLKFKNQIEGYIQQKNYRKLDGEQLFIRKRIDEIVREIQQLDNNLGFISNVSDDNPLVKNVQRQIDEYNDNLEIWKKKLDYLRSLEY
ncbi:MAG TPA: DUF349 domain-containing protein [Flavobacteriaceae bacterium]|nr:DUF349 domain-containing protein [Flavobacteriaceae bacterium]